MIQHLSALILLFCFQTFAQSNCPVSNGVIGAIDYEIRRIPDGSCWHLTGASDRWNLIYRDFIFDDQGFVLVFSSYGEGDENRSAGAREYIYFPRRNPMEFVTDSRGIQVRFTNGVTAFHSADDGSWRNVIGGSIEESRKIYPGDNGGWKLTPHSGVLVDFGFKFGGGPSADKKGRAQFSDLNGLVCEMDNKEFLYWDRRSAPHMKFPSDENMRAFLVERCPHLTLW